MYGIEVTTQSEYKRLPEGKFISDRHKFMWIDLDHDAVNDNLDMSEDGINDLTYYYQLYNSQWNFNLI